MAAAAAAVAVAVAPIAVVRRSALQSHSPPPTASSASTQSAIAAQALASTIKRSNSLSRTSMQQQILNAISHERTESIGKKGDVILPNIHGDENIRDNGNMHISERDYHLWHGAVEAQWILTVLDDTAHKLMLTSLLSPEILDDKIMDVVDHEMNIALREHFKVEQQCAEFVESDAYRYGLEEGDDKSLELYHELDMCVADSTRTVARLLKKNPLLVRRLKEIGAKRSPSTLQFLDTMARLRKLMHHKLRMSAEEERSHHDQLAELRAQEEEDTQRFMELTERLAIEKTEHEQALKSKDNKIMRLTKQMEMLKQHAEQERAAFEQKMEEEQEMAEKVFKMTERDLIKQLDDALHALDHDGSENFRTELQYHRKKNHRAADVTRIIEKYDEEMTDKHEAIKDLRAVYERESKELTELSGYFKKVDAEIRRVAEEHASITRRRDIEMEELRKEHTAANLIQSLYQRYDDKVNPKPKPKKVKKKKLLPRPKPKKKPTPEGETAPTSADATHRDGDGDTKSDVDLLRVNTDSVGNVSGDETNTGAVSEREEESTSITAGGD